MRAFAQAWPELAIVQKPAAQIPWFHNCLSVDKVKDSAVRSLLEHVRSFLPELGKSFALVGSQYHLEVDGQDYYLDLVFYHLELRCFVVINLKMGEFKPEDSGKMNFCLAAANDLLRYPTDQPTIGLILCKSQNWVVAEYALRGLSQPMGVAEWQLTTTLPSELRHSLPTPKELDAVLGKPAAPGQGPAGQNAPAAPRTSSGPTQ